jgi:hypothetical protein
MYRASCRRRKRFSAWTDSVERNSSPPSAGRLRSGGVQSRRGWPCAHRATAFGPELTEERSAAPDGIFAEDTVRRSSFSKAVTHGRAALVGIRCRSYVRNSSSRTGAVDPKPTYALLESGH